jgi:hypothetical protein
MGFIALVAKRAKPQDLRTLVGLMLGLCAGERLNVDVPTIFASFKSDDPKCHSDFFVYFGSFVKSCLDNASFVGIFGIFHMFQIMWTGRNQMITLSDTKKRSRDESAPIFVPIRSLQMNENEQLVMVLVQEKMTPGDRFIHYDREAYNLCVSDQRPLAPHQIAKQGSSIFTRVATPLPVKNCACCPANAPPSSIHL